MRIRNTTGEIEVTVLRVHGITDGVRLDITDTLESQGITLTCYEWRSIVRELRPAFDLYKFSDPDWVGCDNDD